MPFDSSNRARYWLDVTDELFPSGPWVGFYNYGPGDRHHMELDLSFANGRLSGLGIDDVGRFVINGKYDAATLECWWTKTYPGSHEVFYRGFREGKGIWGTWEITAFHRGGFHIWPRAEGEGETISEHSIQEQPAEFATTPTHAFGREIVKDQSPMRRMDRQHERGERLRARPQN